MVYSRNNCDVFAAMEREDVTMAALAHHVGSARGTLSRRLNGTELAHDQQAHLIREIERIAEYQAEKRQHRAAVICREADDSP